MKCCDYHAGMLRQRVRLERLTLTPDGAGGYASAWQAVATLRAAVIPTASSERYYGQRIEGDTTHRIICRYYPGGVQQTDRIAFDGRYFAIRGVIDIEERHRWLQISAIEGAEDGQG